jgi:hypothetical protein
MYGNLDNQIFFENKNEMFITEAILLMFPTKVKKADIIYQEDRYPNAVYFI